MEDSKKKKKGVRLTERDLNIIKWINSHRAATVEQVHKKFGMSPQAAKKRLSELKSSGYLRYEKVFHNKPGIYISDKNGIAVTSDELPAVKIRLGSYEHDLALVDLAVTLEQRTGAYWHTDRQIRHENGIKGVGVKGHSPDGVLEYPSGEKIAVELELSAKGTKRLESILRGYANSRYQGVWYFVSSENNAYRILAYCPPLVRVFLLPNLEEYKSKPDTAPSPPVTAPNSANEKQKLKDFFRKK